MSDFESNRSDEKLSSCCNDEVRTVLTVCPTCRGKGFVADPVEKRQLGSNPTDQISMPLAMPKIRSPPIGGRSSSGLQKTKVDGLSILPSKSLSTTINGGQNRSRRMEKSQPPTRRDTSVASSEDSSHGEIIPQVEIVDMVEFVRRAKIRMKSGDLDEVSMGVVDVVHICRTDENFALSLMPIVNRHLVEMLRSLRVTILRRACQTISNLFQKISYVTRPEFDEMLMLLLKRTGDTKKRIRDDANEALEVLVTSSPPAYVIRALVTRGTESKSAALRITVAKIISRCVNQVGHSELLSRPALRDMRKRVLEAGCSLLLDPQAEVRGLANEFMGNLKDVDGFDEALETDIGHNQLKEVQNKLIWLRHSKRTPISHEIKS